MSQTGTIKYARKKKGVTSELSSSSSISGESNYEPQKEPAVFFSARLTQGSQCR